MKADTSREPRQPMRLLKKRNMVLLSDALGWVLETDVPRVS